MVGQSVSRIPEVDHKPAGVSSGQKGASVNLGGPPILSHHTILASFCLGQGISPLWASVSPSVKWKKQKLLPLEFGED